MAAKYLTVIGGSAGSISVLIQALPGLGMPEDRAIIIVLHRGANGETTLAEVMRSKTSWLVKEAEDKDVINAGNIFLAPGGYHLLIEKNGVIALDYSEKIHFSRPAIDPCFESAAEAYGARLSCLLLSGGNADGVAGLAAARATGAAIAIQDPAEAAVSYMPASALKMIPDITILSMASIADYCAGRATKKVSLK